MQNNNGVISNFKNTDGKVVLIVAANVFAVEEYIPKDEKQIAAVGEGRLLRVIAPGGTSVMIVEPKGQSFETWLGDARTV